MVYIYCSCVLDPGDKIVDCPPTFTMYEFDASVNGALVIKGKNKNFNFLSSFLLSS
jgi:histidinol-phosphate aminotransferase